ncbi:MAG: hypothetical protein WAO95_01770 [Burkholderiales bacterium]
MNYGEVALGVECALPRRLVARRRSRMRRFLERLAAMLKRRG